MKPFHYPLVGLLLLLQYPLWFGSASVTEVMRLQHQVAEQKQHNLRTSAYEFEAYYNV